MLQQQEGTGIHCPKLRMEEEECNLGPCVAPEATTVEPTTTTEAAETNESTTTERTVKADEADL